MAGEFRFRPQHRLLRAKEYADVFAQRRVLRGALVDLHYAPGTGGTARLGLVISKRNAAHSVTRNYCKRLARELFRHRRADLPTLDLVLRLARSTKSMTREALDSVLRSDLDKLLDRLAR